MPDSSWSVKRARAHASRALTLPWRMATPFGVPVDPEVKITCDRCSAVTAEDEPRAALAAIAAASRSRQTTSAPAAQASCTSHASVTSTGACAIRSIVSMRAAG